MVIVPNAFLWLRMRTAKMQADKRELTPALQTST
jgi:hypothetical protein